MPEMHSTWVVKRGWGFAKLEHKYSYRWWRLRNEDEDYCNDKLSCVTDSVEKVGTGRRNVATEEAGQ